MLTQHSVSCIKALYSQWFVEANDSVDLWSERMEAVTDDDDRWFIVPVTGPYRGWLDEDVVDWLKTRA
jgi:hypothetical protein